MKATRELQSILYANIEWEIVIRISHDFSSYFNPFIYPHSSSKSYEYLLLSVYHIINM